MLILRSLTVSIRNRRNSIQSSFSLALSSIRWNEYSLPSWLIKAVTGACLSYFEWVRLCASRWSPSQNQSYVSFASHLVPSQLNHSISIFEHLVKNWWGLKLQFSISIFLLSNWLLVYLECDEDSNGSHNDFQCHLEEVFRGLYMKNCHDSDSNSHFLKVVFIHGIDFSQMNTQLV